MTEIHINFEEGASNDGSDQMFVIIRYPHLTRVMQLCAEAEHRTQEQSALTSVTPYYHHNIHT